MTEKPTKNFGDDEAKSSDHGPRENAWPKGRMNVAVATMRMCVRMTMTTVRVVVRVIVAMIGAGVGMVVHSSLF